MSDTTAPPISENFRKFPILGDRLNDNSLSDQQLAAIHLLSIGKSLSSVAQVLEITPRTLFNWRQDERFRAALAAERRALWSDAAARLKSMVHPSLDVIERTLHDRYDRARFRAASLLLRLADLRRCAESDDDAGSE